MEANTRHLERIFDQTIIYQIPLFQRPYVWNLEEHWTPLWEDIQALLDKHRNIGRVHPHFLGAVVLEQVPNSTGAIESRQVIDGQQRFTTLQLLLVAARDLAAAHGSEKYVERFGDLVTNRRNRIDREDEAFKVWPTNADRAAYRLVHGAGSLAALGDAVVSHPDAASLSENIVSAYRFFYGQLSLWLAGELDDADAGDNVSGKTPSDRLESIWQVIRGALQLVVIDLDRDDETQVIFETLNARGEELLPADLIKNFLFRLCAPSGKGDVEKLYESHWRPFETKFWREVIKQGRIKRPRIDIFINHYLTMQTREEVRSSHLFSAFKEYVESTSRPESGGQGLKKAADHLRELARYGLIFSVFLKPDNHPRLATFLRRMEAIDTTTVFPFLLHAYAELMPNHRQVFDQLLNLIEAYLVRRMIANLTTKNYNRFFVDLIRAGDKVRGLSPELVAQQMAQGSGDSTRFPKDDEIRQLLLRDRLYGRLAQYKIRVVLEALDAYALSPKSEAQPLPEGLTIEHVMPQSWQAHWPFPQEVVNDPVKLTQFEDVRDRLIDSLGNLTLITGSLNPALSNAPWETKRPELLKFSKLNLTRYFHDSEAAEWNEKAIEERGAKLTDQVLQIWPSVLTFKSIT